MSDNIVEIRGITKRFAGVCANDGVSLDLKKGEIHALLGENGAGKSTLMSILFGIYQPDAGVIRVRGKEVKITSPHVANDLRIGMVHQHFKLVQNFTVTENVILGKEPKKGLRLGLKGAADWIAALSAQYGLDVDPSAVIETITVGMQQRVEILKMLYRDAEILIFDEPTAVLTPGEIHQLMDIMQKLVAEGKSIILITHKLGEIKQVADRCTVIRRGRVIGTVEVADTSEQQLAEMMVGREVSFAIDKQEQAAGSPILELKNVSVKNSQKVMALKDVSLCVRCGEILGIAGVDGNGQSELVEAITGLARVESGTIVFKGEDITACSIDKRLQMGLSHIPEDRQKRGLVLDYTIEENTVLEVYKNAPFSRHGLLNKKAISQYAQEICEAFDVRSTNGIHSKARELSGGNQQKSIIGRAVEKKPDLLIAVQPTRGLDVGSIEYIHKRIVEQRNNGTAVLLISMELDEVMQLSDRIIAMNDGRTIGEVMARDADENEIGLMMGGVNKGGHAYEAAQC